MILSVDNLSIRSEIPLVYDLNFDLAPGERLGIIGESGSGKSLTALSLLGLLPDTLHATGAIQIHGTQMIGRPDKVWRKFRGTTLAMIFQEPMSALDPLMRIGKQLRATHLLPEVGLDAAIARRYPHELSGGQRQRVMIAMALAANPDVLICDEPTTALDATTQEAILELIDRLVRERNLALIFISHDLSVVARMSENLLVMDHGHIVERGNTQDVLQAPSHPYTQQLIAASQPKPPATPHPVAEPIIELHDVAKAGILHDIAFTIPRGARVGIVGSSGAGKTTLFNIITGLSTATAGTIAVRGRVQMVFQDPQGSLNPRMRVGDIIKEAIPAEFPDKDQRVAAILEEVGLSPEHAQRFPHEFSGGQRQRISIARAVVGEPDILLADEAVSALDVSIRAQILQLLEKLADAHHLTLLFISHDLNVIRQLCSEVMVVHEGTIVESGTTTQIWQDPQHPYTQKLLRRTREPLR